MNHSLSVAVRAACAVLTCMALVGEDRPGPPRTEREEIAALVERLAKHGVDLSSSEALTREVRTLKGSRAAMAALALALQPKTDEILNELRSATVLGDDLVAVYAAKALVYLKDREWAAAAAPRLPNFRFRELRLTFGGYLALSGRYDGWQDVIDALVDPSAKTGEALNAVQRIQDYVLMNDADGKPVDVCRRIRSLMPQIPEDRQYHVKQKLSYIQSSSFPKDLNDPRWRQ